MSYASASQVAAYCLNLLDGNLNFGENTRPPKKAVDSWLSTGCAIIETRINGAGYDIPIATTATVYNQISDLNALFAAARAEYSRLNITISPGERTRGQLFEDMFNKQLDMLVKTDLTKSGLSKSSAGKIYVGGISVSEKQTREDDTDRVMPRFSRNMFDVPGILEPEGTTASKR